MAKIPKEVIIAKGGRGWGFEKKGFQERNMENLLKVFSKKEATEALTAMGETSKEAWGDIKETVTSLKDIVDIGGTTEILQSLRTQVEESLALAIEGALSPITNTMNTIIGDALAPIFEHLTSISNTIAGFIEGKETGAFFGAMIGSIWGPLGQLIGGLIGAAIEGLIDWMALGLGDIQGALGTIDPWENPSHPLAVTAYYAEFGVFPDILSTAYLTWWYTKYHLE